jgi:hypothetical protein
LESEEKIKNFRKKNINFAEVGSNLVTANSESLEDARNLFAEFRSRDVLLSARIFR